MIKRDERDKDGLVMHLFAQHPFKTVSQAIKD